MRVPFIPQLLGLALIASTAFTPAYGLTDDFTTFDATKWTTAPYMSFGGFNYVGLPDTLAPVTLDNNNELRVTSVMTDSQRQGFGSVQTFTDAAATLTVDFKTLALHDLNVPSFNKTNIDGLLEIYLINPTDQRFLGMSIFANNFAAPDARLIQFSDSFGGSVSTAVGWTYNTYYRFVLSSDGTSTHLSFQNSLGTELAGQTFSQSFAALGGYNIVVSQRMGTPGSQYYSDVALNNLEFANIPEPSTLALCAVGVLGSAAMAVRRRTRRSGMSNSRV